MRIKLPGPACARNSCGDETARKLPSDWNYELESADDVLAVAIGGASKEELQMASGQLPRLIELVGLTRNEVELTSLFLALGIYYRPGGSGITGKKWLQHVHDCIVGELGKRD